MITRRHLLRLGGLSALGAGWPGGVPPGLCRDRGAPSAPRGGQSLPRMAVRRLANASAGDVRGAALVARPDLAVAGRVERAVGAAARPTGIASSSSTACRWRRRSSTPAATATTAGGSTPGPAATPTSRRATRGRPRRRWTSSSPRTSRGPTGCRRWSCRWTRRSRPAAPSPTTRVEYACRPRTRRCAPGNGSSDRPPPATRWAPAGAPRSTSPTASTARWRAVSLPSTGRAWNRISVSSTGSAGGWRAWRRSRATPRCRLPPRSSSTTGASTHSPTSLARRSAATSRGVVSLSLGEMPTAEFGADHISDKVHKGIAHYIYDDPAKHAAMADYVRHHARQVARLIETLEAIPDAGGGSVMDNTLIVWGSELGDGWHGYHRYNPVLIGGSWAFKTGRYLYWPDGTPIRMRVPAQVAPGGQTQLARRTAPETAGKRGSRDGLRREPRRPQTGARPARRLRGRVRPARRPHRIVPGRPPRDSRPFRVFLTILVTGGALCWLRSSTGSSERPRPGSVRSFVSAASGRPQRVTVRGRNAVVVVAADEFDRLRARRSAPSLHDLLSRSPLNRLEFGSASIRSPVREVDL